MINHLIIAEELSKFDLRHRVKFLNLLRDRVGRDRVDPKVSDFDMILFVCDYPMLVWQIVENVVNEK